ncbi:ankyrin repeat domain-containing protein [Dyella acidiphila]|uniref:Ankyrin repeat domain-containing protein n=1 Tax=Dyella acidiphila TaxID=2775866 RepID=A0ABR9GBM0_9GAMM|nr:ankyrin repeat domain-containing protein [Dyella acidiphila]MBE1161435.1 ankyrin repeat domain-containing protein [Dyella acidiphila]
MSNADASNVFSEAKTIALANAALGGDGARVRAMVAEGANPDAQGKDDVTLLEWALLRQSKPAMSALLDAGAQASQPGLGGDTVLHLAAKANDVSYLKLLLDHGADPNAPHGVTQAPPIDAALMNPQNDAFDLLLAHHADPNRPDRLGDTPLHVAAQVHKPQCVLALLKAGADPSRRNKHGDTFQTYFNILPAGGLNPAAQAQHEAVHQWLRQHQVAVEEGVH